MLAMDPYLSGEARVCFSARVSFPRGVFRLDGDADGNGYFREKDGTAEGGLNLPPTG
jgi:hypothetical protein